MTAAPQEFDALLEPEGAWTFLRAPFSVEEVFGSRARVPIKGTINGFAFQGSLFPMGNGTHCLMVNKTMQKGAGAKPGDTVHMVITKDTSTRTVKVPRDFRQALAKHPAAREYFEKLAYTHRKDYVDWIESAKKEETRQRRIDKAVLKLMEG
jgi:hypothetical protein